MPLGPRGLEYEAMSSSGCGPSPDGLGRVDCRKTWMRCLVSLRLCLSHADRRRRRWVWEQRTSPTVRRSVTDE